LNPRRAPGELFSPADTFFFFFALFLEPRPLTDDLLLNFFDLIGLLIGQGVVQLFFEEDFPFGQFALIKTISLGEPGFLFGGYRAPGAGVGFRQSFHCEFIGAFHDGDSVALAGQ
jgi:hypothetical protein